MDMQATAWQSLHSTVTAQRDKRPLSRAGLGRIWRFAQPHRRLLRWFLLLSVITAALAVATPLLAGRVVDTIVGDADEGRVVSLALLIAGIAVAEAGFGLLARWLSARIGEGLILQLRTAVYDHVQRMPVAFFTRTRTGALVSRLNNDVLGAQRAFSNTLSGVVGNLVTLLLTLAVMLRLSWQITLLALVLLPVFVFPARRMGARLARLQREAAARPQRQHLTETALPGDLQLYYVARRFIAVVGDLVRHVHAPTIRHDHRYLDHHATGGNQRRRITRHRRGWRRMRSLRRGRHGGIFVVSFTVAGRQGGGSGTALLRRRRALRRRSRRRRRRGGSRPVGRRFPVVSVTGGATGHYDGSADRCRNGQRGGTLRQVAARSTMGGEVGAVHQLHAPAVVP